MRALHWAAVGAALALSGCGGGSPSSGGGQSSSPSTSRNSSCLEAHPRLQGPTFANTSEAVGAFAAATKDCQASLEEIRAAAVKMNKNGIDIQK